MVEGRICLVVGVSIRKLCGVSTHRDYLLSRVKADNMAFNLEVS